MLKAFPPTHENNNFSPIIYRYGTHKTSFAMILLCNYTQKITPTLKKKKKKKGQSEMPLLLGEDP